MTPRRLVLAAAACLLVAMPLLHGCAQRAVDSGPRGVVLQDRRDAPSGPAKAYEGKGVRYYVGDDYFDADLLAVMHRRITLRAPGIVGGTSLEVTRLELSLLEPDDPGVDGARPLLDRGESYRSAPGQLVIEYSDHDALKPIRCRLACRVDGRPFEVEVDGVAHPDGMHDALREVYHEAIDRLIARLGAAAG